MENGNNEQPKKGTEQEERKLPKEEGTPEKDENDSEGSGQIIIERDTFTKRDHGRTKEPLGPSHEPGTV